MQLLPQRQLRHYVPDSSAHSDSEGAREQRLPDPNMTICASAGMIPSIRC